MQQCKQGHKAAHDAKNDEQPHRILPRGKLSPSYDWGRAIRTKMNGTHRTRSKGFRRLKH